MHASRGKRWLWNDIGGGSVLEATQKSPFSEERQVVSVRMFLCLYKRAWVFVGTCQSVAFVDFLCGSASNGCVEQLQP
jgi:hypothetical protein